MAVPHDIVPLAPAGRTTLGSPPQPLREDVMRAFKLAMLAVTSMVAAGPVRAQQAASDEATLALPGTAMTFAPIYVAEDMGLFAKQGLRVKSVVISGIG